MVAQKKTAFSGGTAAANQLWTAAKSGWVNVPSLSSRDIYIQQGVTTVFSGDALFQNTDSSFWTPHQVDYFVVGT